MTDIGQILSDEKIAEIADEFDIVTIKGMMNYMFARAIESAVISTTAEKSQPQLTVSLGAYPESNGKRNWTATILPVKPWDGLVGSLGGICIARGEYWNRVAYEAERARFMLGLRDTEPCIIDYGDDIETPDSWKGEIRMQQGKYVKKMSGASNDSGK